MAATFPWDGNEIVEQEYHKDNCKVITTSADTTNAVIFFSSNALYYPNSIEAFAEAMAKDRYEWQNVANDQKIQAFYKRIIFVRDVYKQWYIKGINAKVSSIDQLTAYMRKLTEGYNVTTVGCSAGGYAAAIVGQKLGADRMFTFASQFCLFDYLESAPFIRENRDTEMYAHYYDISQIDYNGVHFYFWPTKCEQDIHQHEHIRNNESIVCFPVEHAKHGSPVFPECYPSLFVMPNEAVRQMHKSIYASARSVNGYRLMRRIVPVSTYLKRYGKELLKRLKG